MTALAVHPHLLGVPCPWCTPIAQHAVTVPQDALVRAALRVYSAWIAGGDTWASVLTEQDGNLVLRGFLDACHDVESTSPPVGVPVPGRHGALDHAR